MADFPGLAPLVSSFRRVPADLGVVVALVALTMLAVFFPAVRETPLRLVVGLPFLLFLPGYAFVAALFPGAGSTAADAGVTSEVDHAERFATDGIGGLVRVALSFGSSVAIVTLLALMLGRTPVGLRLTTAVVAVGGFTLGSTVVAAHRRAALPSDERFVVPYRAWFVSVRREVLEPETRTDAALNVLLAVSVLLAMAGVVYAVSPPASGDETTRFYLLSADGERVAEDFPDELVRGEAEPIVVGVTNEESEPVEYTVVVQLQRVDRTAETPTVTEREELGRFSVELADDETHQERYQVEPTATGEDLRLTFLLYEGDPPEEPSVENAYRSAHLWVDVNESDED